MIRRNYSSQEGGSEHLFIHLNVGFPIEWGYDHFLSPFYSLQGK